MSQQDDLEKELTIWQRRLQKRREQKALFGASTDPSIDLEIEDIEDRIEKLQAELAELKRRDESPHPQTLSPHPPFEPELILIPAGEFLMGSDPNKDEDAKDWEQPQHKLYLPDYYIAKTLVTNSQYAAFVEATGHQRPHHWENGKIPKGKEDHPVVMISWHDAVAYCRWLAETTGKPYRLPTEAEWEKAARGTDGWIYPWGNEWNPKQCNTKGIVGDTTPVGAYSNGASPYGVLDMAGNVLEWCATRWRKDYPYDATEDEWNEAYLNGINVRVLRGSAFYDQDDYMRAPVRFLDLPYYGCNDLGFRVVRAPSGSES